MARSTWLIVEHDKDNRGALVPFEIFQQNNSVPVSVRSRVCHNDARPPPHILINFEYSFKRAIVCVVSRACPDNFVCLYAYRSTDLDTLDAQEIIEASINFHKDIYLTVYETNAVFVSRKCVTIR